MLEVAGATVGEGKQELDKKFCRPALLQKTYGRYTKEFAGVPGDG